MGGWEEAPTILTFLDSITYGLNSFDLRMKSDFSLLSVRGAKRRSYIVEVGQHFYWQIGGFQVHAQVLITSWIVIVVLLGSATLAVRDPQIIPNGAQNFLEYVLEFVRDLARTQIGEEEYGPQVPFIGTMFLFIFVSNWAGALFPWGIIKLPHGELAAPTNDINTTVALALLTSVAYFYAGFTKRGLGYFGKYIQPTLILL
ncbi:ATP synthase subunit a, chloroplastic-like [Cryptomeria japonica]|uniref:ATP synthase subunit a, chloroplastic-like n=1 Tax=Cryptomeria japonica TaxID=3369 RepID=UPI0027DA4693|nr:ATP synthase subunit a, chloroplastic-like [Cryptomeria japonica]